MHKIILSLWITIVPKISEMAENISENDNPIAILVKLK